MDVYLEGHHGLKDSPWEWTKSYFGHFCCQEHLLISKLECVCRNSDEISVMTDCSSRTHLSPSQLFDLADIMWSRWICAVWIGDF